MSDWAWCAVLCGGVWCCVVIWVKKGLTKWRRNVKADHALLRYLAQKEQKQTSKTRTTTPMKNKQAFTEHECGTLLEVLHRYRMEDETEREVEGVGVVRESGTTYGVYVEGSGEKAGQIKKGYGTWRGEPLLVSASSSEGMLVLDSEKLLSLGGLKRQTEEEFVAWSAFDKKLTHAVDRGEMGATFEMKKAAWLYVCLLYEVRCCCCLGVK